MPPPVISAPGVYLIETDNSQTLQAATNLVPAFVITATQGVLDEDVLVTSYNNFVSTFGIPSEANPGTLVVRDFFQAGGAYCHVTRVGHSPATASVSILNIDGSTHTGVTGLTPGSGYNNNALQVSYSGQVEESVSDSESLTESVGGSFTLTLPNAPVVAGTVVVEFGGTQVATDNSNGNIVFAGDSSYTSAIWSGTVDYNTGAVTITATSSLASNFSATVLVNANYFSTYQIQVLEYVYNNSDVLQKTYVVEYFPGLNTTNTVDQVANSNYIVIADNPATFPAAGTYTLSGGTDGTSGIQDSDYIGNNLAGPSGMQIYAAPDQIAINVLAVPGASQDNAVYQAMIELVTVQRGDSLAIIDPPEDLTVQEVAQWANAQGSYSSNQVIDSNAAAIYFPWYNTNNSFTNDIDLTPPCSAGVQALARSNYWEAPAGPNRGIVGNFAGIATTLNPSDREFLGLNRINPIANLNNMGTMVLGQYTATTEDSSLDRIGARMCLFQLEKATVTLAYQYLFEPNDAQTWQAIVNAIQPYLTTQAALNRIYAGQIFCDAITNTSENVQNNVLVAVIVLELLDFAEIIVLNFQLQAYSTSISESVISATTVG
jgi:uncharacterized protein